MARIHRSTQLTLVAVALCLAGWAAAQPQRSPADSAIFKVTAQSGVPEIPFKLINNHLIMGVSVNGSEPLDVALDTGMPAPGMVLYGGPHVDGLGLSIDPAVPVQVGGAGGAGKRLTAGFAPKEMLALEGLTIAGSSVIVMPSLPDLSGYHDGIIGYSLFERFVVELDYDRRRVRLHDPAAYKPPAAAEVLPLTLRRKLPYLTVQVAGHGQEPFAAQVVVDLGASHAISLNTDGSELVEVPEKSLAIVLGRGLSGPVEGKLGRIATLKLGGAEMRDVLASFPRSEHQNPRGVDSLAGNLGSEVLRRFKTTFDYPSDRVILEPNKAFDEPFRFDRAGMRLFPGDPLEVESVIAGSPADEAGIRIADVVTHVNGKAVSGEDYGDVREALMADGTVRLLLRRGEEVLEKTLTLRRLI